MATEFPLFNALVALSYQIFGIHDWNGRLINWIITCLGLWFFYRLVLRFSSSGHAIFTTVAFMASITFQFALKTMPDTFSLSLVFAGAYLALRGWDNQNLLYLILSALLITLGVLSKIPSIVALVFLLPAFFNKEKPYKPRIIWTSLLLIGGVLVISWYFIWMPHLLETYKNQLIWPVSLVEGWRTFLAMKPDTWLRFEYMAFTTKMGLYLTIAGLAALIMQKRWSYLLIFAGYSLVFFLFILKTGNVFATHNYYIIPFTPMMAFSIGYFINEVPRLSIPVKILLLVLLLWPGYAGNFKAPTLQIEGDYYLKLASLLDPYISRDDKIMVNKGNFNPTMMYFAKRRGWTVYESEMNEVTWMPGFKEQGLTLIVVDKHITPTPLPYTLVYEDDDFAFYRP
jgi:4-amino-4-deoxy-L-arabinose transferase-like glycosyltransferase